MKNEIIECETYFQGMKRMHNEYLQRISLSKQLKSLSKQVNNLHHEINKENAPKTIEDFFEIHCIGKNALSFSKAFTLVVALQESEKILKYNIKGMTNYLKRYGLKEEKESDK